MGLASDLGYRTPGEEFAGFSSDELLRWFNEGRCMVAQLRPDMFSRPVNVELQPGAVQSFECCRRISKVLGQSDEYGQIVQPVAPTNPVLSHRWTGRGCPAPRDGSPYRLQGYLHDPMTPGMVTVDPPVPVGAKAYAVVLCTSEPAALTLADADKPMPTDCGSLLAVDQWVVFRAYSRTDEESVEYRKGWAALKLFFQILNVKFRADLMYELGVVPVPKGSEMLDIGRGLGSAGG